MKDVHKIFTAFKKDFPSVFQGHEALGKAIHEESGPLPEKTRWLVKVAVSGASGHTIALETHSLGLGRQAPQRRRSSTLSCS